MSQNFTHYYLFIFSLYSPQGDTPLILASKQSMIDIVKLLLKHGADSAIKDNVKRVEVILLEIIYFPFLNFFVIYWRY